MSEVSETEKKEAKRYAIRWAYGVDYDKIMQMVWETFLKFEGKDYTEEGIKNFQDFIFSDTLYQSFVAGAYQIMIALDRDRIVGMASVRNRHHLSLLFVQEDYHKQGIGSALITCFCNYLQQELGEKEMTVWAAPYALEFYKKLGFDVVVPEQMVDGIRITTMRKAIG